VAGRTTDWGQLPRGSSDLSLTVGRRSLLAATLSVALDVPARGTAIATERSAHWLGCAIKSGIYDLGQVEAFERAIGQPANILLFFQPFSAPWNGRRVDAVVALGLRPMVTLGCGPDETIANLVAGRYDTAITTVARQSRETQLLVRVMHEMNGNWVSYGQQPRVFRAGWRRIHALWRAVGNDAPFVWTPNITGSSNTDPDLAAYYPGDDLCDVVGLDGYRSRYQTASFKALFDLDIGRIGSISSKPIIIAEVGADPRIPGAAAWIAGMFDYLATRPRVIGLTWWDRDEYVLQPGAMADAFATGLQRWSRPA
jgi:mannan endo-1,4-beta-mannosidase